MYGSPESIGQEIVRPADIPETADDGGNDRRGRLQWASGFIDADGSFGVYVSNKGRTWGGTYTLVLQVAQVNPAPLQELQQLWGGTIRHVAGNGKRRDYFIWTIAGRRAWRAMDEVGDSLIGKRDEMSVAREFWAVRSASWDRPMTASEHTFYEECRRRMTELKHLTYR